jgi:hypothetical protein
MRCLELRHGQCAGALPPPDDLWTSMRYLGVGHDQWAGRPSDSGTTYGQARLARLRSTLCQPASGDRRTAADISGKMILYPARRLPAPHGGAFRGIWRGSALGSTPASDASASPSRSPKTSRISRMTRSRRMQPVLATSAGRARSGAARRACSAASASRAPGRTSLSRGRGRQTAGTPRHPGRRPVCARGDGNIGGGAPSRSLL